MNRNTSPKGFWRALERLAPGAVMRQWERELGSEQERARPFLRLSNTLADTYPCTNSGGCGNPHLVEQPEPGHNVAVCLDEWCPPIALRPEDLFVFSADIGAVCAALAKALGLNPVRQRALAGVRAYPVGTFGPATSEVYLMIPEESGRMAREVERLFCAQSDPFVLLTPTGVHCSPEVGSALRRQLCMHVALCEVVGVQAAGALVAAPAAAALFGEFLKRCGEGRGVSKTIERIDRNMEAVARGNYELRREADELRQFQADGFFKFALRVDGEDFRAFAVIMALGNRKAAADFLKVPHRSFYDRVEKWSSGGKEYQKLARWIDWRKKSSRKIKLRLEDSVQSGEPNDASENPNTVGNVLDAISAGDNRDYPAILSQVMETLKAQNPKNWSAVRDELVAMIRDEV